MGKSIFKSKTVWANVLMAAASIGTYFQNSELLASHPEALAVVGAVVGVVNVLLRLITKDAVSLKG